MRVYLLTLSVAVSDQVPEVEALNRIRATLAVLEAGLSDDTADCRIETTAILVGSGPLGDDPPGGAAWHRAAGERLSKPTAAGWLQDGRTTH